MPHRRLARHLRMPAVLAKQLNQQLRRAVDNLGEALETFPAKHKPANEQDALDVLQPYRLVQHAQGPQHTGLPCFVDQLRRGLVRHRPGNHAVTLPTNLPADIRHASMNRHRHVVPLGARRFG